MYIQNFKDNTKHISSSTDSSTLLKNITNSCIFIAGSVFSFFFYLLELGVTTVRWPKRTFSLLVNTGVKTSK